ncbi:MAG: hypothetical protein WCF84_19985 [Anaerolineae bacterium]
MPSFFSRDELSDGFPGRRASTLLFAVESRTAHLVEQGRRAAALYLTPAAFAEREKAFLGALSQGRDVSTFISVQDLERYAPQWQPLLPDAGDANTRAGLARLIGQKYALVQEQVPNLRAALALDTPAVAQAYERLYGQPLSSLYTQSAGAGERVHWGWNALARRIDVLPPFWLAFALTLPGTVGLLGMPIALAGVTPLTGILLLILFGLFNLFTVAALAEAVARTGTGRFGLGFLGQLVQEYLGHASSVLLSVTLTVNNFFVLIIFFIGIAGTLDGATHLPPSLWVAAIFGVCLYFLWRGSLNATVTFTLSVVLISLVCLFLIPLLALPYFKGISLGAISLVASGLFNPGILLSTYFSHFLVASYAPVVLRRDPTGRAWIRGSAAAIVAVMLIAIGWIVIVNGVLDSQTLASATSTVLDPLAAIVGPIVLVIGSVLVILSLGLSSVQVALGLYYLVRERLPGGKPLLLGRDSRFWLAISPVVGVFVVAEWLTLTGTGSFASLLGILGAMALPTLSGVFPVLLLVATRHKGDYAPGAVYRVLGNPILLTLVYLFFLGIILAYGLFIFDSPVSRGFALAVFLVILGVTIQTLRGGALRPRLVIELRDDQSGDGPASFVFTENGAPLNSQLQLDYGNRTEPGHGATGEIRAFAALQSAHLTFPATGARELKVWVHRLTAGGGSRGLAARVEIDDSGSWRPVTLDPATGEGRAALGGALKQARIILGG